MPTLLTVIDVSPFSVTFRSLILHVTNYFTHVLKLSTYEQRGAVREPPKN